MKEAKSRYPLSLEGEIKERAAEAAKRNRRSLNSELGLLIEEGFKWREMQSKQAAA
ncbi:Arc family DNA-binding protein [Stutzerimonas sp. NM35]